MEQNALREWLRFVDKKEAFQRLLSRLDTRLDQLSINMLSPGELNEQGPTKITAEYMNNLFEYYYASLRYLFSLYSQMSDVLIRENEFIEHRKSQLEDKISNIEILLDKIKNNDPLSDYRTIKVNGDIHLDEYRVVDICASFLDEVSVSTLDTLDTEDRGNPELAVDGRNDTLWNTVVEADGPVLSSYDGQSMNGVLLQYKIELDRAAPVNYLYISPMSLYPMHLVGVKFYYGGVETVLEGREETLFNASWIDKPIEFRFRTIMADMIELYFVQEHYDVSDKIEVIREVMDTTPSSAGSVEANEYLKYERIIKDVLSSVKTLDPEWLNALLDKIGFTGDYSTFFRKTRKYLYNFGADTIKLAYITYQPEGFYVSDSHELTSNVYKVSLDTEDTFDDGHIIQYYIKLSDDSNIPIIPESHNGFVRERLYPVHGEATTTFSVSGDLTVYVNGDQINSFSSDTLSDGAVSIKLDGLQTLDSVYYVEYSSDYSSAVAIEDLLDPEYVEEDLVFDTSGKARLSGIPYVDMEIINDSNFVRREGEAIYDYTSEGFYSKNGYLFGSYTTGMVYVSSDSDKFYCTDTIDTSVYTSDLYITVDGNTWPLKVMTASYYQIDGDLSNYYEEGENYAYTVGGGSDGPVLYYTPLEIYVDDVRAINQTSYEDRSAIAFTDASNYRYYVVGRNVYMNKVPTGSVRAKYNKICEYISCVVEMHQTGVDASETPVVSEITMKLKPRI